MHGEKHIDHYQHRTSPMETYKHEFKKSKSRLVLGNTIPLSPCSFSVAWLSIDLPPIEPFPFDLSRRDDKRRYVVGTNVWQTWRGGAGRWFRKDFSSGNLPRIDQFLFFKMDFWPRGLGNKTKEMNCSLLSLRIIYFVLFPQALEPSMNFNMSKVVQVLRC